MIRRRRSEGIVPRDYWDYFAMTPFSVRDEMDRLFDDFKSGFESFLISPKAAGIHVIRTPVVDLLDEGKEYKIHAEMPGINKEDLNIEVSEGEVEISAETKAEKKEEDKEAGYIRRERRYSKYYRRIPLPEAVKVENAEAELKDGILTITLPKILTPETKGKKIQVK